MIANAASGVVVGKVGTATASADEVKALLPDAVAAGEADPPRGDAATVQREQPLRCVLAEIAEGSYNFV